MLTLHGFPALPYCASLVHAGVAIMMFRIIPLAAAIVLSTAAILRAADTIIWYETCDEMRSVVMQEPGPYERSVLESIVAARYDIPPAGSGAIAPWIGSMEDAAGNATNAAAPAANGTETAGPTRDARPAEYAQTRLEALDKRSDAIDRAMQDVQRDINYKRYREDRIFSRNEEKCTQLQYEINQLRNTLKILAEMKMNVELTKHALQLQLAGE